MSRPVGSKNKKTVEIKTVDKKKELQPISEKIKNKKVKQEVKIKKIEEPVIKEKKSKKVEEPTIKEKKSKKVEVPIEKKEQCKLTFMDNSLVQNEIPFGMLNIVKNNTAFAVSANKDSQIFEIVSSPEGKSISFEEWKKIAERGFKLKLSLTYMQKLLIYMFATPESVLDKKLRAVKKDIIKNTKFYNILDIDRGENE